MWRTSSITVPSMVGIVGCAPAVNQKVWCFFVFFFVFGIGITKFVITVTLWSSVIFKTITVSFHSGKFVVVHLYSTFYVDPKFSHRGKFIPKLRFFAIFEAVGLHFKARTVKFGVRVRTWDFLPKAKYSKNRLRGYTPFGQIYTKNYQFRRFWWL